VVRPRFVPPVEIRELRDLTADLGDRDLRRVEDGALISWDDQSMGELDPRPLGCGRVPPRGTWSDKFTEDGWFCTGDVVRINERGDAG
jgi:hypothetical protein